MASDGICGERVARIGVLKRHGDILVLEGLVGGSVFNGDGGIVAFDRNGGIGHGSRGIVVLIGGDSGGVVSEGNATPNPQKPTKTKATFFEKPHDLIFFFLEYKLTADLVLI